MTADIDREDIRQNAEWGIANCAEGIGAARDVLKLLDALDRAEAQSAIRGRAVTIYQQRAREAEDAADAWQKQYDQDVTYWARATERAEARIEAVLDMCDSEENPDQWPPRPTTHGGTPIPARLAVQDIRRALEG